MRVRVVEGIQNLGAALKASVLTVGNFDGVHVGHRLLLSRLTQAARTQNLPSVVVTFDPHPVQVLYPERGMRRLFDLSDIQTQMRGLGVDILVVQPFSREFSKLPPIQFVENWLVRPFRPRLIIVGYDFSFGANRQGSIEFLMQAGEFAVDVVSPVMHLGAAVSSTRIRQAVEAGEVELAAELLGRAFYVRGEVEHGAGRGRTIGVPTANLKITAETVPARGVYAAIARVRGQEWPAAVNIGLNPTFASSDMAQARTSKALTIEAHLIGFPGAQSPETAGNIYGETVSLEFIRRLRDEMKFSSVADLVQQIQRDIRDAKKVLTLELEKRSRGLLPGGL